MGLLLLGIGISIVLVVIGMIIYNYSMEVAKIFFIVAGLTLVTMIILPVCINKPIEVIEIKEELVGVVNNIEKLNSSSGSLFLCFGKYSSDEEITEYIDYYTKDINGYIEKKKHIISTSDHFYIKEDNSKCVSYIKEKKSFLYDFPNGEQYDIIVFHVPVDSVSRNISFGL